MPQTNHNNENISIDTLCRIIAEQHEELAHPQLPGLRTGSEEIATLLENAGIRMLITPDIYKAIIMQLSDMHPVYPDNYESLAFCLEKHHYGTDLMLITHEDVLAMVSGLKNFKGPIEKLSTDHTTAIVSVWAELLDDGFQEDGFYDSYI